MNAKGININTTPIQTGGISTNTRSIVFQFCRQASIEAFRRGSKDIRAVIQVWDLDHRIPVGSRSFVKGIVSESDARLGSQRCSRSSFKHSCGKGVGPSWFASGQRESLPDF